MNLRGVRRGVSALRLWASKSAPKGAKARAALASAPALPDIPRATLERHRVDPTDGQGQDPKRARLAADESWEAPTSCALWHPDSWACQCGGCVGVRRDMEEHKLREEEEAARSRLHDNSLESGKGPAKRVEEPDGGRSKRLKVEEVATSIAPRPGPHSPPVQGEPVAKRPVVGPSRKERAEAWTAAALGSDWKSWLDPSHRFSAAIPVLFCRGCGHYCSTRQHAHALRDVCGGAPSAASVFNSRLRRMSTGRHPTRDEDLDDACPLTPLSATEVAELRRGAEPRGRGRRRGR